MISSVDIFAAAIPRNLANFFDGIVLLFIINDKQEFRVTIKNASCVILQEISAVI